MQKNEIVNSILKITTLFTYDELNHMEYYQLMNAYFHYVSNIIK